MDWNPGTMIRLSAAAIPLLLLPACSRAAAIAENPDPPEINKDYTEAMIEVGLQKEGLTVEVMCPEGVTFEEGKTFHCIGTFANSPETFKIDVTIESTADNGTYFWHVDR